MFHLLVSYSGWPENSGSISNSRIYIRPDEEPGKSFLKNGRLDQTKVVNIPALLTTEIDGDGPAYARVVHITSITQGSSETSIQYTPESGLKPIPIDELVKLAPQLGISTGRLTHTHWEIKQADLFKILLLNQQKVQPTTMVFNTDSINQPQPNLVSVMMPFGTEFNPVYTALQNAVHATNLKPMRADNFWEHHFVIQDIVNLIGRARIVICDLSSRNPNVFYETGIAHSLGKEVILITQSDDDVPFDLRHIRYIKYLNNTQGLIALSDAISNRIRTLIG